MNTHADKVQGNKSKSVADAVSQKKASNESTFQFVDNRPVAVQMRKLQELVNNDSQLKPIAAFHGTDKSYPIQRVKLEPNASYVHQPGDKAVAERGQRERSEGLDELHSFHGSFRPESVDQAWVSRDEIIKAIPAGNELWANETDGSFLTGTYDFVILPEKYLDGALFLLPENMVKEAKKAGVQLGHTSIMRGIRASEDPNALAVTFAGMISFSEGVVVEWNGQSGHYLSPDLRGQADAAGASFLQLPMRSYSPGISENIVDDDLLKFITHATNLMFRDLNLKPENIKEVTPDILKPYITQSPFFLAATRRTCDVLNSALHSVLNNEKLPSRWIGSIAGEVTKYFRKYKEEPSLIDGKEKKAYNKA